MNRLDFVRMQPMAEGEVGLLPEHVKAYGLKSAGADYAIYLVKDDFTEVRTLQLELPKGNYSAEWIYPLDARSIVTGQRNHAGGPFRLDPPQFRDDLALVVRRR